MARGVVLAVRSNNNSNEGTDGTTLSVPLVLLFESACCIRIAPYATQGLRLLSMVNINADEHQSLLSKGRRQGVDRSPPAESTKLIHDLFLGDSKYYY